MNTIVSEIMEPADEAREKKKSKYAEYATPGLSMGSALAMVLSFQLNHSVLWAILHGICSWLYVIYRVWQGNY